MAIYIEREVVDPKLWLAHADLQNNHASETPFIENIFRIINPIRKMRITTETSKTLNHLARGMALALLLSVTSGVLPSIFNDETNNKGDNLYLEEVQLSFKPDQNWYLVNCDKEGNSRGTGFSMPEEFTYAKMLCRANFLSASSSKEILSLVP